MHGAELRVEDRTSRAFLLVNHPLSVSSSPAGFLPGLSCESTLRKSYKRGSYFLAAVFRCFFAIRVSMN